MKKLNVLIPCPHNQQAGLRVSIVGGIGSVDVSCSFLHLTMCTNTNSICIFTTKPGEERVENASSQNESVVNAVKLWNKKVKEYYDEKT
jgi:hypothetical protein